MLKRILSLTQVTCLLLVLALSLSSCRSNIDEKVIRLMVSNAMGSGGLFYVVEDLALLDKYAENAKLELSVAALGPGMNEGILAGRLDGASMNIINFLIGIDVGVPYKIATSVSYGSNVFVTNNPNIKSIGDITENDRIAIPDMTRTGGVLLRLAAEQYFGSYDALDELIVIMGHDDAVSAIISNSGGISVTPVSAEGRITLEKVDGYNPILIDRDLFEGELIQGYFVFSEGFYNNNTELAQALLSALGEACTMIQNRDEEAINILARRYEMNKDDVINLLDNGDYLFVVDNYDSIETFGDILLKSGIISSMKPLEEIIIGYKEN